MAEDIVKALEIKINGASNLKELNAAIKECKSELEGLKFDSEEYQKVSLLLAKAEEKRKQELNAGAKALKDYRTQQAASNNENENAVKTVSSVRKAISGYRDELLNLTKGTEEYNAKVQQIIDAENEIASVTKIKRTEEEAAAGSIRALQEEYKALYAVYKELGEEERNTAEGQEMATHLKEISDKLNETKKAAGDFHDNIGHYAEGVVEAFSTMGISVGALQGPLKLATQGTNGLKTAFSALAKHPIIAAIAGLILLFKKATGAIKNNEEHTHALHSAMASFQPIIDAVSNGFDVLAGVIVKAVGWIGKAVDAIRKAGAAVTDFLGITKGAKKRVEEQIEGYRALADAENELIKQKREFETLNSIDEAAIANLRDEAAAAEDAAKKRKLIKEAIELQNKVTERNVKLAEEDLRIAKERAKLTANSAKDNDELAKKEQAVNNARADGARKTKELTSQVAALAKASRDAYKSVLDEIKKNAQTELDVIEEKYRKELKIVRKNANAVKALTAQYNSDINKVVFNAQESLLSRTLTNKERKRLLENIVPSEKDFNDQIKILQEKMRHFQGEMTGLFQVGNSRTFLSDKAMSQYLEATTEEERKAIEAEGELNEKVQALNDSWGLNIRTMEDYEVTMAEFGKEIANLNIEKTAYKIERLYAVLGAQDADYVNTLNRQIQLGLLSITESTKVYAEDIENLTKNTEELTNVERKSIESRRNQLGSILGMYEMLEESENDSEEVLQQKWEENKRRMLQNDKIATEILKNGSLERIQILQDYYNAKGELENYDLQRQIMLAQREKELMEQKRDMWFEFGGAATDSISSLIDTYSSLIDEQVQEGKISELEKKRKIDNLKTLEKVQLGVAIAGIVADTASGVMSANKAYAAELVTNAQTAAAAGYGAAAVKASLDTASNVSRWLRIASLVTQGVASAAAAAGKTVSNLNSLTNMGNSSSSSGVPQIINSDPYSYTRTVQTDAEREEMLNKPIVVSVVDIDNAQNARRVRVSETTW